MGLKVNTALSYSLNSVTCLFGKINANVPDIFNDRSKKKIRICDIWFQIKMNKIRHNSELVTESGKYNRIHLNNLRFRLFSILKLVKNDFLKTTRWQQDSAKV